MYQDRQTILSCMKLEFETIITQELRSGRKMKTNCTSTAWLYDISFFILFIYNIHCILFYFVLLLERHGITSDSSGSHLAAVENNNGAGGYIYTSSEYGVTWTNRTIVGAHNWYVNYYMILHYINYIIFVYIIFTFLCLIVLLICKVWYHKR